ncbi:MAG TPA: DUF3247 family protein, partial [Dokdonella sp.]
TRMGHYARHVCTDPGEIARIEQLVTELPSQARVRLHQRDGAEILGVVTERPAVQLFQDADGIEGVNAFVRLDDPDAPPWSAYIWLSDIERVERLDVD